MALPTNQPIEKGGKLAANLALSPMLHSDGLKEVVQVVVYDNIKGL